MFQALRFLFLFVCLLAPSAFAETPPPDDSHALAGVKTGKVVFDINIPGNAQKLALYLKVIRQTHADLVRQGVAPDMILAFRGKAVTLITRDAVENAALDQEAAFKQIVEILAELGQQGVRVESCSVATKLFKVSNDKLLPGVVPVGNTFVSLIGYQARGYATIPIY